MVKTCMSLTEKKTGIKFVTLCYVTLKNKQDQIKQAFFVILQINILNKLKLRNLKLDWILKEKVKQQQRTKKNMLLSKL